MDVTAWQEVEPVEMVPGVTRRTLVYSDELMVGYFELEPGAIIPIHDHHHQQAGFLIQGSVKFVGEREALMKPGSAWMIPSNQKHGVEVLGDETAIVIETFHPAREDYIP